MLLLYEIKCNLQTSQGVHYPIMKFIRKRSGDGGSAVGGLLI